MIDIQSATAENRQGKKEKKRKKETTDAKYNGLSYWAAILSCIVSAAETSK